MKTYEWWPDVIKDYFSPDKKLYKQAKQYIKWNIEKYGYDKQNYDYFKCNCNKIQITKLLKDIPELLEYFI